MPRGRDQREAEASMTVNLLSLTRLERFAQGRLLPQNPVNVAVSYDPWLPTAKADKCSKNYGS